MHTNQEQHLKSFTALCVSFVVPHDWDQDVWRELQLRQSCLQYLMHWVQTENRIYLIDKVFQSNNSQLNYYTKIRQMGTQIIP